MNLINKQEFYDIINRSMSKSEVAKELGYNYINGKISKIINDLVKKYNCDISYFSKNGSQKNRKYKYIIKKCPICNKKFQTKQNFKKEKTTCSHSCANTYFRSGLNSPNYQKALLNNKNYRTICFNYHKKKCVCCNESLIVEVHHFDENKKNNSPDNLIPLCPTHHRYQHSRYKNLIYDQIVKYRKVF